MKLDRDEAAAKESVRTKRVKRRIGNPILQWSQSPKVVKSNEPQCSSQAEG